MKNWWTIHHALNVTSNNAINDENYTSNGNVVAIILRKNK